MPAIETATQTDSGIEFGQLPESETILRYDIRTHISPAQIHNALQESGQQVLELPMTAAEVISVPAAPPIELRGVFNGDKSRKESSGIPEVMPIPIFPDSSINFTPTKSGWSQRNVLVRTSGKRRSVL